MKRFYNNAIVALLAVSLALVVFGLIGPSAALAATTPSLGAAASYGVLAGTYTNSSAATTINGDVGFTTGPAQAPLGTHTNYGPGAPTPTARTDAANALSPGLSTQGCTFTFPVPIVDLSTDGGFGGVYTPGVYCSTGAMNIGVGGITLNGNGTYIFRAVGALTSTAGAVVTSSGASACDVFWTPTAATTLAANTTFWGTIIDNANAITVGANTVWTGRALSLGAGTVTTGNTDTITVPTCTPASFHIIKQVVNTGGGTAVPSSFNLHVKLSGTDVLGSPQNGTSTPGSLYSLSPGAYVVSEDANASYTQSFSGACDSSGNITLASADNKTCTITNTYIPPVPATLHVIKLVVNTSGGTAIPANFIVHVKNASSTLDVSGSPQNGTSTPGSLYSLSAGTYLVSENANTPPYTQTFLVGGCDSNGSVTLLAGDDKICTIINTDIPPPAPVTPSATVNVPGGWIIPLIGIKKVPSPLALPAGSAAVTYNYTVWNVGGQQALTSVTVTDDKCGPVNLLSGDINNNGKLDINENWKYSCTSTLSNTTTNTAIASGYSDDPHHQVAIATAIATVVVGAPLPPPLINIVKVPSRLTPFPFGGGVVTYTYTVTNPGVASMNNVVVTDDKCAPVSGPSGDTNGNDLLDPGESWVYTCRSNVQVSTRNVATVKGSANGFTTLGYAFATVLVSAPGLSNIPSFPNTGLPPEGKSTPWNIAIPAGILAVLLLLYTIWKRKTV